MRSHFEKSLFYCIYADQGTMIAHLKRGLVNAEILNTQIQYTVSFLQLLQTSREELLSSF